MKNFKFSLIWPIILSLSMFCDQLCHAMLVWDNNLKQHVEISVDDFFTKNPALSSETYFESFAHFAEHEPRIADMANCAVDNSQEERRGVQVFWIPERLVSFGRYERDQNDPGRLVTVCETEHAPFYGLDRFLDDIFNRRPKLARDFQHEMQMRQQHLPVYADKVRIIFNDPQERIEFGNRLYTEICTKLEGRAGFNDEIREEFCKRLNRYNEKPPELVRPMPSCFYSGQSRFWIGSSFVLTFGLSLIGCVAHHFRKNVEDVTEQEKSDRKKLIICCAVLAAISGAVFAASYWELGSRYDYKYWFTVPPPAPKL